MSLHLKARVPTEIGIIFLIGLVLFVAGITIMNPFVLRYLYEYIELFIILAGILFVVGIIISLWWHQFRPLILGLILTAVLPILTFCIIVLWAVAEDLVRR